MSREIDQLIAEKVMNFSRINQVDTFGGHTRVFKWRDHEGSMIHDDNDLPYFSTDMGDAWRVVEKFDNRVTIYGPDASYAGGEYMNTNSWSVEITGDFPDEYDSQYRTEYIRCFEAETAPMAICLAALKAKGINVQE